MLAVVKEPRIELSLGGEAVGVAELLKYLRERYLVEVVTLPQTNVEEEDESVVEIRESDFWKENAMPGRILAGYRLKHELTQKQLSERCGIHPVVISTYENGKRKISRKAAVKIARALGEDEERFFRHLQI